MGWLERKQEAQDLVEYGLILATIGILVLLGGATFGARLREWFEAVVNKVTST